MYAQLASAVETAEMVLIGIGEEWKYGFDTMWKDPLYADVLEKAVDEYKWIIPYLEYVYMHDHSTCYNQSAYNKLYDLVKNKNYFVISTCLDRKIYESGFSMERCVFPCGSYEYLQSRQNNSNEIVKAVESDIFVSLMSDLHMLLNGKKRICDINKPILNGDEMVFNQKRPEWFDVNYNEMAYIDQWQVYTNWISKSLNHELLILELGVGFDFPSVIRWPFEKITFLNKKAYMIRVHEKMYQLTADIKDKAISVPIDSVSYIMQEKHEDEVKE